MESRRENIEYKDTDFTDPELLNRKPFKHRRSPIIVTLDDHNIQYVDIQKLMEAGMNVIRFKMSQFTRGEQLKLIGKVDKATNFLCTKYSVLDWPVATCIELKTCIIRTGLLEGEEESIVIKEGKHVVLSAHLEEFNHCTTSRIFVDNQYITVEVQVGMFLSIAQDEIIVQCIKKIDDKSIRCLVIKGGVLRNMSLVSIRGGKNARPLLTKKDLQIVRFALEYQVDIIIINYARRIEAVQKVKKYIGRKIKRPLILVGISSTEGLNNIDGLIKESDGIVFAREFLAFELEESVRHRMLRIQKWVCGKCQQAGKPFYLSGGIFKEALSEGLFTVNQSVDVTNAILDGATGFILKDCLDIAKTIEVLEVLNELCCNVEPLTNTKTDFWRIIDGPQVPVNAAQAAAISCALVAHQNNSRVIIIPTVTGDTAKILMWLKPASLVVTVSTKTATTRRLQSYRCVVPLMFGGGVYKNWEEGTNARVEFALKYAVKLGWLEYGDSYVTLQRGTETSAFCDTVRAWTVNITKQALVECNDDDYLKEP